MRRGNCEITLCVLGGCTLSKLAEILDRLDDAKINVDWATLDLWKDRLYFTAYYYEGVDVIGVINDINSKIGYIGIADDEADGEGEYDDPCD